jgi:hypothetical protein
MWAARKGGPANGVPCGQAGPRSSARGTVRRGTPARNKTRAPGASARSAL